MLGFDRWMESGLKANYEEEEAMIKMEEEEEKEKRVKIEKVSSSSSSSCSIAVDEDLLFSQILSRLPVKSLMRFKSVCKRWKSIIERDSHFIDLHLARSESRPPGLLIVVSHPDARRFIHGDDTRKGCQLSFLTADMHCDDGIIRVQSVKRIQSSAEFLEPVRGLLCLVDRFAVQICNVSTGEVTPWIESRAFVNAETVDHFFPQYYFGFDPSSGKHKVISLWWRLGPEETPQCTHCEVLTVGDDNRWRIIDDVPPWKTRTKVKDAASIYANGSIYWFRGEFFEPREYGPEDDGDGVLVLKYSESLMAFDFGSEKFRVIPVPEFTHLDWYTYDGLIEMDGCLAVIRRRNQTLQMWKFHDYNKGNGTSDTTSSEKDWTEVDIKLPSDISCDMSVHPMSGKGQLILETYDKEFYEEEYSDQIFFINRDKRNVMFARFYSYDLTNKTFSRLRIRGVPFIPMHCVTACATSVESLLPLGKKKLQD